MYRPSNFEVCVMLSILCVILIVTARATEALPSWNMQDVCGQTISRADPGGYLVLDAPDYLTDCRVVIQPAPSESSSTSGNNVLFYFSSFGFGEYCQDTNVTVYNGNGTNPEPIAGLKVPMCGANSSLNKDVTFRTQSSFFSVRFQREPAGLNLKAKFNLTFFSFSEGSCGSEDETLFSCKNNRCINKTFTCMNLNPCGDNSDCATVEDKGPTWIETYVEVFNKIKIAILVITGIVLIIVCINWKRVKKWICDCYSRLSEWVASTCHRR